MTSIPAMKEAAERATPGDWTVDVRPEEADVSGNFIVTSILETSGEHSWPKEIVGISCCCCGSGGVWEPEDAAHIALSNPKNVLALISVVEEARRVLKEVRDACLYEDDDFTGITQEPHISPELFDRINTLIKKDTPQ